MVSPCPQLSQHPHTPTCLLPEDLPCLILYSVFPDSNSQICPVPTSVLPSEPINSSQMKSHLHRDRFSRVPFQSLEAFLFALAHWERNNFQKQEPFI